jgi:serine/threonine protein kinase
LNSDRWQQIKQVFNDALQRERLQRAAFLAEACADDLDLRAEVEKLLASYETDFMDQPAVGEVASTIVSARQQLRTGQRLGRYRIAKSIGAGGMGEVYLAHDTELERDVALKILTGEVAADQQRMRRFVQEAKTASALNHPNIITIYEVGQAEGSRFIATEYIKGDTLRQRMRREPLSLRECFEVALQVATALSAAHEAKVVHRDIKPENIMLRPDGLVKVLDFGLAKLTETAVAASDPNAATRMQINTAPGIVMGTFNYMSPEQARGKEVDLRTDIWSFGVVLYEMLTGHIPFTGETSSDVIAAILKNEPAPLSTYAPDAPAELQRITRKALRKERDERYQTIKDLLLDLKSLQRELELAAEMERTMAPELRSAASPASISGNQVVDSTAQAATAQTRSVEGVRTASSAEYIVTQIRSHRRSAIVALAVLLLAGAALSYLFYFRRASKAPLTAQDTILLADFDNKTDDPIFDGTLRQGLAVQLQQSPFLNFLPDAQVRQTLRLMNHAPDERITRDIAREICQRQELKALIAGTIAKFDRNYSLTLEAVNCQTGDTIALTQAQADGKDQVLASLSTAANDLREKLGESLSSIKKFDVPIDQLTTGSLDALKAYSLGFDRSNRGKYFESIPLFKHATELDPNFAYAYGLLAGNYTILNQPRHAAENAARAFALKERVSEREKLQITNFYYSFTTGELDKSVETLEVYKRTYPRDFRPPGNLSFTYSWLGQFEKALGEARASVSLNPNVSAWQVALGTSLLRLNRFGEAKEVFARAITLNLDDPRLHTGLYEIAFIDHDTPAMQQQLDWARSQPDEFVIVDMQTRTASYAGQWRQAQGFARQAIDLSVRADVKEVAAKYAADQGLRAAVLGRCEQTRTYAAQSLSLERNQVTLARVALSQALCGDNQAQSLIDEMLKQYSKATIVIGLWVPTIRATLELTHGNAAKAIELLEGPKGYEPVVEFWTYYLRGQAYLKLDKGMEAAAEFNQILGHRGQAPLSILYPLAQLGLARAAELSGDTSQARKAYEDFLAIWKDADADLSILQAARAERGKLR